MVAAGWYYAENDPPNTQRYWDGAAWVGHAVPIAQAVAPPAVAPSEPPVVQSSFEPETAGGYTLIAPPETAAQSYGAFDVVPLHQGAQSVQPHAMQTHAVQPQWGQQTAVPMGFDSGITVLATVVSVLKAIPLIIAALAFALVSDLTQDLDGTFAPGTGASVQDIENLVYLFFAIAALPLVIQAVATYAKRPIILFVTALLLTLLDLLFVVSAAKGSGGMWLLFVLMLFAQAILAIWAIAIARSKWTAKQAKRAAITTAAHA